MLKPGRRFVMEDVFGPDDEAIREKRERVEIIDLLRANLNVDLGGFQATEVEGEMIIQWPTIVIAAEKE